MFTFDRPIRFEEVDAAGIVFFARYLNLAHEAMEAFFGPLEGGYVALINQHHLGVPAVKVDVEYKSSLRYGDVAAIQVTVTQIGRTSATFHYEYLEKGSGRLAALVNHKVVLCDLRTMRPVPWPDAMRALLEEHSAAAADGKDGMANGGE
jgi:4-hydroxybenzoyl-CoA thioesterase